MNKFIGIGNATAEPEVRDNVARFTLAINERYAREGQEPACNYIRIVGFGKTAEFIEKYVRKGSKYAVEGRVKTGSYTDKDGKKVYTTDIVAESIEFCERKGAQAEPKADSEFMAIPDGIDEELPFC